METKQQFTFFWNGRKLVGSSGDTVASALWRNGIRVVGRSRKLHRPLGLSGSYVAGVLARVGGIPNVRLDLEPCRAGLVVEAQTAWPGARHDLRSAMQFIPSRLVRGSFEHGRLVPKSGSSYMLWERIMSILAGGGAPPDASQVPMPAARRVDIETLVIGGGPAGIGAANAAAASGASVALVTRGHVPARYATAMGAPPPMPDAGVQLFLGLELFGAYREGRLFAAAPHDPEQGAVVFAAEKAVLATGRRSMPPLVLNSHVPGVMDAHAALELTFMHGAMPGNAIAVVGTGAEAEVAERLKALGTNIVHVGPVRDLRCIYGRRNVNGIESGRRIECDAVIHAGPWHADPGLAFQIAAEGHYQLLNDALPPHVSLAGGVMQEDEPIHVPQAVSPEALVCPCMDVTAGELIDLIETGETDPEVLKRLTSCGMGPCQGYPCWESMIALLAARTGLSPGDFQRPSHRPPRRAITVAQAAALADMVEPDR